MFCVVATEMLTVLEFTRDILAFLAFICVATYTFVYYTSGRQTPEDRTARKVSTSNRSGESTAMDLAIPHQRDRNWQHSRRQIVSSSMVFGGETG